MDISNYPHTRCSLLCFLLLFVLLCVVTTGDAGEREDIINAREVLTVRLDSLEMEKQIRKRQGKPLGKLESESRRLRDSIAVLRKKLAGTYDGEEPPRANGPLVETLARIFHKPANIFDWLVTIIGAIALLSGALFISGLVHTIFSRARKPLRSQAPQKQQRTQTSGHTGGSPRYPPAGPSPVTDSKDENIASLRRRMKRDIDRIQRFNETASPFSNTEKTGSDSKETDAKESLRQDILHAAQQGLDYQEISRKFHVSVDQVSLIVRVASRGDTRNR